MSRFEAFRKDTKGHVAIIFSLALLPLVGLCGLAADYARLRHVENQLQSALDSTVLMLARHAPKNDAAALVKLGTPYFNALAEQYGLTVNGPLQATRSDERIYLAAGGAMQPAFGPLFGINDWAFTVKTEASYGTRNIEVALVLDNTGSMAAQDKIGELKKASHSLLKILKDAAIKPGQIKVSLVPYTTYVNVGTDYRHDTWLTNHPSGTGFLTWEGYKLPAKRAAWDGCIAERDAPFNTSADAVSIANPKSLFTMVQCDGYLAKAMPLTDDFGALDARVDTMGANGWTNITLGAQVGMEMLSKSAPFDQTGTTGTIERFVVLLTDGQNTKDRWTGIADWAGSPQTEARMNKDTLAMCNAIKGQNVKLYTVLVIDGNDTLLRNCASAPDMFRKVQQANQLEGVFKQIANEIGKISLTM